MVYENNIDTSREFIQQVLPVLKSGLFKIENFERNDNNFGKYIESICNEYINFYKKELKPIIEDQFKHIYGDYTIGDEIIKVTKALLDTINYYLCGNIRRSRETFFNGLKEDYADDRLRVLIITLLEKNTVFYRARVDQNVEYTRKQIFHIPYSLRGIIPTSRYSIPGYPALYLSESTYTCWEELERCDLKSTWFSKFTNTESLNVLILERSNDVINQYEILLSNKGKIDLYWEWYLVNYIISYPIIITSMIKVKNPNDVFKPEYIIPQLITEFVAIEGKIDGIKFPSTKIDSSKLINVPCYNYVFPVKSENINNSEHLDYCSFLSDNFSLTSPTSLKMEEIYNYSSDVDQGKERLKESNSKIEIIEGVLTDYNKTSFGMIERILNQSERKLLNLNNNLTT